MQPRHKKELIIWETPIAPREGVKVIVPSIEFPRSGDLNKIIEIHVLIGYLGHKPRVRSLGILQPKVMIASVQVGTRFSP